MDSIRKWFYRPRRDDPSLLAQFYYADEELNLVASELDTFDGRKDPERCTALVNQLRHCQDKVVSLCMSMMEAVIPGERANRDFRAKFPDDVMQENLAGQLWFGAECLAAGSSILNREGESSRMRPLAKAVTKTIETVRNLLREQCLRPMPEYTEKIRESLKIFDRLFSEFELSYVSAMVPVKSPEEHEVLQCVVVLFSETISRALVVQLITQDQVDDCDPALMFTIPRLAIVAGLLFFPDGPLNLDSTSPRTLSHLFRPFRTLLSKIRELLWTMTSEELAALEKSLCSMEEPQHSNLTLDTTYTTTDNVETDATPAYVHTAYTSNFIQSFLACHPDCRTLTADTNLLHQTEKRATSSSGDRKRESHRSRSSRTRMRQERLSNRFLAKLTGIEERPRVKRRQKRTSDAAAKQEPPVTATDETVARRPSRQDDPYNTRRQEYLAQMEVVKRRQALFYQCERMHRRRHEELTTNDGINNYQYQRPSQSGLPSHGPNSTGRPAPPPPPPYPQHNDTDSDHDKSNSSGQRRYRRRRRDVTYPSPHSTEPDRSQTPRVPPPMNDTNNYSHLPEPLPRYSIRYHQREDTQNSGERRSDPQYFHSHNHSTPRTDTSHNFREQLSPNRSNVIQSIDCSCGSTLQSDMTGLNLSDTVGQSGLVSCDGSCTGSNSSMPILRPTSIYLSPESDANTGEHDDRNYNVVNIGECVSSAVAADPTIFGAHNLYQNQDMPAPDYQVSLPPYQLDQNSSTLNESLGEVTPHSSILEENLEHISNTLATSPSLPSTDERIVSTQIQSREGTFLDCNGDTYSTASTLCVSNPYNTVASDCAAANVTDDMADYGDARADDECTDTEIKVNDDTSESLHFDTTEVADMPKTVVDAVVVGGGGGGMSGAVGGAEESSSCSGDSGSDGGVMSDDELNDEEVALALQTAEVTAAWRARSRFSDPRDLIQRLFVCISGVADQLQTNYASDLRRILKTVFLLNQTPSTDDEKDLIQPTKEGKQSITDHDAHSTSNDSESLSVESAEDALLGLGSSQPSSPSHLSHMQDDPPPVPPTVCVPSSVFTDHALLQFSEVGARSELVASSEASTPSPLSPHQTSDNSPSVSTPSTDELPSSSTPDVPDPTTTSASIRRSAGDEPPCWIPDQEAPRCMACGAAFTVLRRRHHCRNCGKVFCGGCSQHSVPLTHYGIWKPVRVCNMCFLQYVTAAAS